VDPAALRAYVGSVYETRRMVGATGRVYDPLKTGIPQGWGEVVRDLAIAERAVRTVETGLGMGLSALFLCEALVASGDPEARHVAMDPFQREWCDDTGLRTLHEAGLADMLEFHRVDSHLLLPRLAEEGRTFDLGFIDGSHLFEGVFVDLCYMHRIVKPGGAIVLDDMGLPAVRKAVAFFERNLDYERIPLLGPKRRRRRLQLPWRGRSRRMAALRRPTAPDRREWDHFRDF
jgi:predicted O-methyltransferase YrrM